MFYRPVLAYILVYIHQIVRSWITNRHILAKDHFFAEVHCHFKISWRYTAQLQIALSVQQV